MNADARQFLRDLAVRVMQERGLRTDFKPEVLAELAALTTPDFHAPDVMDRTHELWCSIDDDDSRDLDQITVAQDHGDGRITLSVAIADVASWVAKDSLLDVSARANTTSLYTSAHVTPMLPERLSTDLTSLNPNVERLAVVTDIRFATDGAIDGWQLQHARVLNRAKLAYDSVAAFLTGDGPLPAGAQAVSGMDAQLRLQDRLAQTLQARRQAQGALEFHSFQPRAVFDNGAVVDIALQAPNRARQLIAEAMIATNEVTARFITGTGFPSIRRVVRSPDRWASIVALAAQHGATLPPEADSAALEAFLLAERTRDPVTFPDLSLAVVKLMGAGEYVLYEPGAPSPGHFGLAVRDYAHATAPNRRYPDLITQRLILAALAQRPCPYTADELKALADHCNAQETLARKTERQLRKSEAAMALQTHLHQVMDAIVTGLTKGSVWVRTFAPPTEGRLNLPTGSHDRDRYQVGQRLRVRLASVDVERGHIDFDDVTPQP